MRLAILLLALASCVAPRVERQTLVPPVIAAWPAVRLDVMRSLVPPAAAVQGMDEAVALGTKLALRQVNWAPIADAAVEGINNQLATGEIGPNGAQLLMSQLTAMDAAMAQLQSPVLVSSSPLVISRSSWATHPPPAIAGSTYR